MQTIVAMIDAERSTSFWSGKTVFTCVYYIMSSFGVTHIVMGKAAVNVCHVNQQLKLACVN